MTGENERIVRALYPLFRAAFALQDWPEHPSFDGDRVGAVDVFFEEYETYSPGGMWSSDVKTAGVRIVGLPCVTFDYGTEDVLIIACHAHVRIGAPTPALVRQIADGVAQARWGRPATEAECSEWTVAPPRDVG